MKLKAVHLEGFRGATKRISVSFDPSKSVTILFGENGSGKSTVVDAIDFACNQSFGSLDDKSLSGEKKHNHVASLTNAANAVPSVDVEAGCGTLSARLLKDKIAITHIPAGSVRPVVSVLRRSQILQLIDATPAKRFEALRSFFHTPNWTMAETAVRQALKTKQDQFSQQTTRLEQATSTLQTLWKQQGSPNGSAEDWATAVLAAAPTTSDRIPRIRFLEQLLGQVKAASAELRAAVARSKEAGDELDVVRHEAADVETATVGSSLDLVSLLEHAGRYLQGRHSDGTCPVCVQPKDAVVLEKELSVRIQQFAALSAANTRIRTMRVVVQNKEAAASLATESHAKLGASLIDAAVELQMDQSWIDAAALLAKEVAALNLSNDAEATAFAALEAELQPLRDEITDTELKRSVRDSVRLQMDSIAPARAKATELEAVTKRLSTWLASIEASRKEVLDKALADMSSDVSALYSRIHPGEGASSFSFAMKANAVSSLDFKDLLIKLLAS